MRMANEITAKQKERADLNAALALYEQQGGQIERVGNLQAREVRFNPSDKGKGSKTNDNE